MTNYIIVDDEPLAHDLIEKFATDLSQLSLSKRCYNAMEALEYLNSHQVDLMFLDINMPKLSGFEMLRTLRNPPKVIVTSAYQEYAIEGYELNVSDYLLKPFSFSRFVQAVNKALTSEGAKNTPQEKTRPNRMFIKGDKQYHQIDLEQLMYVEAYGNYTKLHLEDKTVLCHESISIMESTLSMMDYLRIHKSYIVTLNRIERIVGNRIYIGEHAIPIGQTYKRAVQDLLK